MKRSQVLTSAAVGSLAVLLAVTGCSSSKPESSAGTSASAAAATTASAVTGSVAAPTKAGKDYNVAFIQGVAGDEFYITMQCGIEAEAAKLGVTVNTQGAQKFDPTLQTPILDSVVASKPDAILIAPTDVTAMQKPLENAAAAGIKVVMVDTTTEDPSFAVSQVSSDNEGGGAAAFKAIKDKNPKGGKVLVISTDPGISTVDARVKGFETAVGQDSTFEYLGVQYSHNDPATAAQLVTAALQKDPDIVGIFATNIFSAEGSSTGVKQAGKSDQMTITASTPARTRSRRSRTARCRPWSRSSRPPSGPTGWTRPSPRSTAAP